MKKFTGFAKTFTAGIGCALALIFMLSTVSVSAAEVVPSSLAVASTSAIADAENSAVNTSPLTAVNSNIVKPIASPQTTNSAAQLASLLGGLALILVLIYGLSWFVKRFSQGGFMQNPSMKIVSALPLGTRERLLLVEVGGKQLLLGVTATQINSLHVFDAPFVAAEKSPPLASDFSQKLMAILQQKTVAPAHVETPKTPNS